MRVHVASVCVCGASSKNYKQCWLRARSHTHTVVFLDKNIHQPSWLLCGNQTENCGARISRVWVCLIVCSFCFLLQLTCFDLHLALKTTLFLLVFVLSFVYTINLSFWLSWRHICFFQQPHFLSLFFQLLRLGLFYLLSLNRFLLFSLRGQIVTILL